MRSLLIENYNDLVSKEKNPMIKSEAEPDVAYSTGFLSFDFLNGSIMHVKSETKDYRYYSCGLIDGSIITLIGRSGCGKSTFAVQAAANIIRPYEYGVVFEDQVEAGVTNSRREILTGFDGEELKQRWVVRNTGITAENMYQRIRMIYDSKMKDRDKFVYDTGLYDVNGERIYKLQPTVYILDSLAMLATENVYEADELGTSMSQTASAKANSIMFKQMMPYLKSANIILIIVNHINEDVSINPMQRKKAQIAYLKQGETIPGGRKALYASNAIIRFDESTKLKPDEAFYIQGAIVDVSILKSRTAAPGKSIPLFLNQATGFDPILSLFLLMKSENRLAGAGAYLKLESLPDVKFSQRNFKEKYIENEELREAFNKEVSDVLKGLVSNYTQIAKKSTEYGYMNSIMNIINPDD